MSLLDPKWKYTHSSATDIRKTFARARRELAKKQQQASASQANVHLMGTRPESGPAHARNESGAASRFSAPTISGEGLFGSGARALRSYRGG